MPSKLVLFALLGSGLFYSTGVTARTINQIQNAIDLASAKVEVPQIMEASISADGSQLAYVVSKRSVARGAIVGTLYLQAIGKRVRPTILAEQTLAEGYPNFAIQWRPASATISWIVPASKANRSNLVLYDTLSGNRSVLSDANGENVEIEWEYKWSPNGQRIAYTDQSDVDRPQAANALGPTMVSIDKGDFLRAGSANRCLDLYVFDLSTSSSENLTSQGYRPTNGGFSWAPTSDAIAYTTAQAACSNLVAQWYRADIAIADMSRRTRLLVSRAGSDSRPSWSPDGKFVSFNTSAGRRGQGSNWLALASVADGAVTDLPNVPPEPAYQWWSPGGRHLYAAMEHDFGWSTLRIDTDTRRWAWIDKTSAQRAVSPAQPFNKIRSVAADGKTILFTSETKAAPADLFLRTIGIPKSHRLTDFGRRFKATSLVDVRTVEWRGNGYSATLKGLVLTPRAAWKNGHLVGPLPTLVSLQGGPMAQITNTFNDDQTNGSAFFFAARGYAVFIPTHRGRSGYGDTLRSGLRQAGSGFGPAYNDVMAGLDELVTEGIADPNRLGVYGQSYGGGLTAYTVTKTNRFRAAMIHNGGPILGDWFKDLYATTPSMDWSLVFRDEYGWRNPYDADERQRILAESPALNANHVKTAVLFLQQTPEDDEGLKLFASMRRFDVPTTYMSYPDGGHVFTKPRQVVDFLLRGQEWFDFWVRGIPYSDSVRAKEYEDWKRNPPTPDPEAWHSIRTSN